MYFLPDYFKKSNALPRSKEITTDTFQILFAFGKLNRQIPCVFNYLVGSRDGTFKEKQRL